MLRIPYKFVGHQKNVGNSILTGVGLAGLGELANPTPAPILSLRLRRPCEQGMLHEAPWRYTNRGSLISRSPTISGSVSRLLYTKRSINIVIIYNESTSDLLPAKLGLRRRTPTRPSTARRSLLGHAVSQKQVTRAVNKKQSLLAVSKDYNVYLRCTSSKKEPGVSTLTFCVCQTRKTR